MTFTLTNKNKKIKEYTNKYDKYILVWLIWILLLNLIIMFGIIKEINWSTIWLFSLSLLIIRFFLYKIFYRKYSYLTIIIKFLKTIWQNLLLWIFLMWIFAFYQNEISPAKVSITSLSNNKKDVVFIEMAHIWWADYYNRIDSLIKQYWDKGYVLYYEWIELDVPKSSIIDKLGIMPTPETYKSISKALWSNIQVQDTLTMIKQSKKARNTDVKFSELLNDKPVNNASSTWTFKTANLKGITNEDIKKRENAEKAKSKSVKTKWWGDIDNLVQKNDIVNSTSPYANIIKYWLRAIFNFSVKHEEWIWYIVSYIMPKKEAFLSNKVLAKRNGKLVYNIVNWKDQKIMVTYWSKHFKWVLADLKKNDPNWKIINTKSTTIFK